MNSGSVVCSCYCHPNSRKGDREISRKPPLQNQAGSTRWRAEQRRRRVRRICFPLTPRKRGLATLSRND